MYFTWAIESPSGCDIEHGARNSGQHPTPVFPSSLTSVCGVHVVKRMVGGCARCIQEIPFYGTVVSNL